MNIGWVSATPQATTGYGTQTKSVCSRLMKKHNVVCIGTAGPIIVWGGRQTIDTPHGKLSVLALSDEKSAPNLINDNYAPNNNLDIIIGFMDAFGLEYLNKVDIPVIGWIPIDGPFTESWKHYLRDYYKILTYSEFGYDQLLKFFPASKVGCILHGIDTDTFSPKDKDEIRDEMEEEYDIPKDATLYMNVGANVGPRKELPLLMHTFSRFVKDGHEAYFFLHTNAYQEHPRGYDLIQWRIMLDMEEYIHFPKYNPIVNPVPNKRLAEYYTAADVYVQNSVAEGCGLPLLEAMSCETPIIAAWNSAQKELIEGHGWITENVPKDMYFQVPIYVPQLTNYPVPNQKSLLNNLKESYNNPDLRRKFGREARKFVVDRHSWDIIMPQWYSFLDKIEDELQTFKKIRRGLMG